MRDEKKSVLFECELPDGMGRDPRDETGSKDAIGRQFIIVNFALTIFNFDAAHLAASNLYLRCSKADPVERQQGDAAMNRHLIIVAVGILVSTPALADEDCNIPDGVVKNVQSKLATVVNLDNGGLFHPNRMWSAVVDRQGILCSVVRNDPDAWPGSRSIAIAKASTANDFSNNKTALSTANLYSFTQPANNGLATTFPAGSLYGLNNSNPFNPEFQAQATGIGRVPGGIITFGGGVPLYMNGQVIGGLGVSGDTACADHAIAFRMRRLAGLDGTPSSDNIVYLSPGELPHDVGHPHCFLGRDITP